MYAVENKLLVKSYANQKDAIVIQGKNGPIQLWLGKQYENNYRAKNPVVCEIIDNGSDKYPYLKAGDKVLVHHNFLGQWKTNPFCIEYNIETGEGLYAFELNENVFCKLNDDGSVEAVCDNIIGERIEYTMRSELIIIPDSVKKQFDHKIKVTSVAPEIKHIKAGDVVLIEKMADYEICYTFNKIEYRAIKVWKDYIWGKWNNPN